MKIMAKQICSTLKVKKIHSGDILSTRDILSAPSVYRTYFFENKAYKSNFFYIELKQKRLEILNTD